MAELTLQRCPETGICTIARDANDKVDLMPDEVEAIRDTGGDPEEVQAIIAESDRDFAASLSNLELALIADRLR